MFPRKIAIAGCLLLLSVIRVTAQTSAASSVESAKRYVVPILCVVRDAKTGNQLITFRTLGSGFIIERDGVFITAQHVIKELRAEPFKSVCKAAIGIPLGGWKWENQTIRRFIFNPGECQINMGVDIAVCRTFDDPTKFKDLVFDSATLARIKPAVAEPIGFSGFPLNAIDPLTSIGIVAGFEFSSNYNMLTVDKGAWPGASGSPIYRLDNGEVVGMVLQTGTGPGSGLTYGILGEQIRRILSDAKANWSKPKQ